MNNHAKHFIERLEYTKSIKRRPWTEEEDEAITFLVDSIGIRQWTVIAEKLRIEFSISGRTGKQCRERWHNHLDPGVNKDSWTEDEDIILFKAHKTWGNKWAMISRHLPGRTDNSIKNHYYSCLRKQYRKLKGADASRQQLRKYDALLAVHILNDVLEVDYKENEYLLDDLKIFGECENFENNLTQTGSWALSDEFMVLPIGLIN